MGTEQVCLGHHDSESAAYCIGIGNQIKQDEMVKGTKFIASTLLEEFVHCRYRLLDESRDLQTWLFDRLITMGEEYVVGEPP